MQARTIRHNAYKRIELAHVRFCVHTKAHSSLEILPKMTVKNISERDRFEFPKKMSLQILALQNPALKKFLLKFILKLLG